MNKDIKILLLHNAATVKEEEGIKVFSSFPQDLEIIKAIKSLGYNAKQAIYESDSWEAEAKECDLIFNLCDAFEEAKEEIEMIKKLEALNIPFTGCSSEAAILGQDKHGLKEILKKKGVATPEGCLIKSLDDSKISELKYPSILKPLGEDGSNGIDEDSVVMNENDTRKKLSELFVEFKRGIVAEEFIDGREFNVPLIGNKTPFAFPPLEIDYGTGFEGKPKILTYKAKWSKNSTDFKNTHSGVAKINEDLKEKLSKSAIAAYKASGFTGYGSVDMRMDEKGNCFVIEVNPNCYIAPEADIVKAAKSINMTYEELLDRIIKYGLEKAKINIISRN